MTKKYIAIAGNVGVGKSTMVKFLCDNYQVRPFFEYNAENPYLEDFYKDMKKWAFPSQVHFLSHKFRIHQELAQVEETVIQDRSIYEDAEIFAMNLFKEKILSKRDYETYFDLYRTIANSLQPPDLMIYLECPVRTIKKRIQERGRESEKNIKTAYLSRLNTLYKEWIDGYQFSPVLKISTEKLDYMNDFIHRVDLLETIEKYL